MFALYFELNQNQVPDMLSHSVPVICLVKQTERQLSLKEVISMSVCVCVCVCVFAEMQREHQRREHRLQEAHCCALSTMEEARQHQIRVGL